MLPVPEVKEPTPRYIEPIVVRRPAPVKRVIKKPPPRNEPVACTLCPGDKKPKNSLIPFMTALRNF